MPAFQDVASSNPRSCVLLESFHKFLVYAYFVVYDIYDAWFTKKYIRFIKYDISDAKYNVQFIKHNIQHTKCEVRFIKYDIPYTKYNV